MSGCHEKISRDNHCPLKYTFTLCCQAQAGGRQFRARRAHTVYVSTARMQRVHDMLDHAECGGNSVRIARV